MVLALGSNLGDRLANLQGGVDALAAGAGLRDVAVSPVYQTAPVGGPDQPDYLNAVLVAATTLPARVILDRGQAAEAALRRVRAVRGARARSTSTSSSTGTRSATTRNSRCRIRARTSARSCSPPGTTWSPDAVIPGRGRVADLLAVAGSAGLRRLLTSRCGRRHDAHPAVDAGHRGGGVRDRGVADRAGHVYQLPTLPWTAAPACCCSPRPRR